MDTLGTQEGYRQQSPSEIVHTDYSQIPHPDGYLAYPFWYFEGMVNLEKPHASGLNGAIAAQLRAERVALGLSNDDLAEQTGIPVVSIQRYLAGTRKIDIGTLEAIAAALGVTATQIVRDAEARLERLRGRGDDAPSFAPSKPARAPKRQTDEGSAAINRINDAKRDVRPARTRDEMQQLDDVAARDEDTTA